MVGWHPGSRDGVEGGKGEGVDGVGLGCIGIWRHPWMLEYGLNSTGQTHDICKLLMVMSEGDEQSTCSTLVIMIPPGYT